jgi:hypothetical protein
MPWSQNATFAGQLHQFSFSCRLKAAFRGNIHDAHQCLTRWRMAGKCRRIYNLWHKRCCSLARQRQTNGGDMGDIAGAYE